MDAFKNHFYLFSVVVSGFSIINKTFTDSLGSLAKFSTLPEPQFAGHASRIAHCGLEIYGLLLVFLIHKHSISLQLFRKQTSLLKYILVVFLISILIGNEDYQKIK